MNSTHAAWINLGIGVVALVGSLGGALHLPWWSFPILAGVNVAAHGFLPDAPVGAGFSGVKSILAFFLVPALGLSMMLGACSSTTGGAPLTPAQVQQNAQTVLYYLQAAGCLASGLAGAAAPIVTVAGDAKGQQVLSAVGASGGTACTMTVPASALPAPAAPSSPAVTVPVKA